MNSTERELLANDAAFQLRIKLRVLSAANDLLAAPQPVYVTNYCQLIIIDPLGGGWLLPLTYGVLTNAVIDVNSTDNDLQFTVNSIMVKYAKAYYRITD